jgi:hypothetical protein
LLSDGLALARLEEKRIEENRREEKRGEENTNSVELGDVVSPKKKKVVKNKEIKFSKEGADLIKSFESINPACRGYYNREPQRQACEDLIEFYGFERVKEIIEKTLPKTNQIKYFPVITTPISLRDKFSALESAILKFKNEKGTKNKVAFS